MLHEGGNSFAPEEAEASAPPELEETHAALLREQSAALPSLSPEQRRARDLRMVLEDNCALGLVGEIVSLGVIESLDKPFALRQSLATVATAGIIGLVRRNYRACRAEILNTPIK